ncbi:hypothetical protein AA18889_0561 [Acetobacter senegalensis DSM 18889]|nr:hypothetical protein AA18889_0561 [Acetobacter senegalensis DSM 18889]
MKAIHASYLKCHEAAESQKGTNLIGAFPNKKNTTKTDGDDSQGFYNASGRKGKHHAVQKGIYAKRYVMRVPFLVGDNMESNHASNITIESEP